MFSSLFFGNRADREDAAQIGRTVSFAATGKIWTLSIEQAQTTRYLRRPNERYLVVSVLIGFGTPSKDIAGELLPDHTAARITSIHRGKDGAVELVLAVSLETGTNRVEVAA